MRTFALLLSMFFVNAASGQSFQTLKREAEKGDAIAQLSLSVLYYDGGEVPKNHKEAYIWYLVGIGSLEKEFTLPKDDMMSEALADYTRTTKEVTGRPPTAEEVKQFQTRMQEGLGPLLDPLDLTPAGVAKMQKDTKRRLNDAKANLEKMLADAQKEKPSPDEIKNLQELLALTQNELLEQKEVKQGAEDYSELVTKLTANLSPDELAEAQAEAKIRAETIRTNGSNTPH